MSFDKVVPGLWMLLSSEERNLLADVFGVHRSGITEVRDQTVVSDGRTAENLAVITAEAMAAYVGSMETFPRLWELTVAKVRSELNPPVGVIVSHEALVANNKQYEEELKEQPKKRATKKQV